MHSSEGSSRRAWSALAFALLAAVAWSPGLFAAAPAYQVIELEAPDTPDARPIDAGRSPAPSPRSAGAGFDFDQSVPSEVEPNNDAASAQSINAAAGAQVRGNVLMADTDFFSFQAQAGDRVYAATSTGHAVGGNTTLALLASDGTTVIETDLDDGSMGTTSSTIAGAILPTAGTYYLRVTTGTGTSPVLPYRLFAQLRSGAPTPETEPNNVGTPQALPAGNWASGVIDVSTDNDAYLLNLNAGDTIFLSLDIDPERDNVQYNGRLGLGAFGTGATQILVVNDGSAGSLANPLSEAFFMTVKDAGQYLIYVDATAGAAVTSTYTLSATVFPFVPATASCTTYTSTDVPQAIPTDLSAGTTPIVSTITVPGNPRIADIDVEVDFTHSFMQDLDVQLISPAGNNNGLFSDIGAATVGGPQTGMKIVFDDEAGSAPTFALSESFRLQPEAQYRLSWFDGEDAGGVWTLAIRDDATGDGGTLNAWSITVCEPPPIVTTCPVGTTLATVYQTDFEADDGGFTSSGTLNEWERGLPSFVPLTTCASGSNCFVTDLDNTYENSSDQTLLSPAIDLTGFVGPVRVSWNQRYNLEPTHFDQFRVTVQEVGGANPTEIVFPMTPDMTNTVGNPTQTILPSAGWAIAQGDASAYAGAPMELAFRLTTDSSVPRAGVAIDDVTVTACEVLPEADLAITKTDGVSNVSPGGSTTYTITASNAGPDAATGATVADTFPAELTCTWTCVGAGGGTCTAAGSGNINDVVNLPTGGSVTYTASCSISPSASGSLVNTATVTAPGSVFDPDTNNNSATDTDTVDPTADLAITKTDGINTVTPGQSVVYTINASNAGPGNVTGATVADTFPASLTGCTWTCAGSGGGTCPANGSGNINANVNLPAGGSASFSASCTVAASATGSISNTATVAAPGGVVDPTPGNNSATDTDMVQPTADVEAVIVNNSPYVQVGGQASYVFAVTNNGPSAASTVNVTGSFPPALLANVAWTCSGAGGGACGAPAGSGGLSDTANLPSGGSVMYAVTADVIDEDGNGNVMAMVQAAVGGGVNDPQVGNNQDTVASTVVIFRDGFELAGGGDPDIVVFDNVNFQPPPDFTGGSVQWDTGGTCTCNTAPHNFNIWASGATMAFFWPQNANGMEGGVSSGGTTYDVLSSGATIGPSSNFIVSAASAATAPWRQVAGIDGYLGFRFRNPDTNQINFGYVRIQTTGTGGFPATIVSWAYNQAGDPITIP